MEDVRFKKFKKMAELFKSLASPARLAILEVIYEEEKVGFNELQRKLAMPPPTLAFHLKSLGCLLKTSSDVKRGRFHQKLYSLSMSGLKMFELAKHVVVHIAELAELGEHT